MFRLKQKTKQKEEEAEEKMQESDQESGRASENTRKVDDGYERPKVVYAG